MKLKRAAIGLFMLVILLVAACDNGPDIEEQRKWLADRAEQFINVYRIGYDKIAAIQGNPHPCTKGHKAKEAALFHAVLQNLRGAFTAFKRDVEEKLGKIAETDLHCREVISSVEGLARPFIRERDLNQCGKVDAAAAKARFFLRDPAQVKQSVTRLRREANTS